MFKVNSHVFKDKIRKNLIAKGGRVRERSMRMATSIESGNLNR
jgi:hypothetical protein